MKRRFHGFRKKMKNDRKGAAMEMAIALLVVTFALSTLVLTTSLLQYTKQKNAQVQMTQSLTLEQIGQSFCSAVSQGLDNHSWTAMYPDYNITVDALTLTVADKINSDILLTVELSAVQDVGYTITKWSKN